MTLRKSRVVKGYPSESGRQKSYVRALERQKIFEKRKEAAQERNARLTGRWFCERCKIWHPKTGNGPRRCPKQDVPSDIIRRIEIRLAQACGQRDSYRDRALANIVFDIDWCSDNQAWASARQHFLNDPDLGPYIRLLDGEARRLVTLKVKNDSALNDEQRKLVLAHWPLILSVAKRYAPDSPASRDDLVTYLLETLIALWPQYDKTLGVTFGAFARLHLMGAARDHIKHRPRTISIEPEQIDIALRDKTRKLPKQKSDKVQTKHWSMGDKRLDQLSDGKSGLWQQDRERYASSYWDRKELDKQTARFVTAGGIIKRYGEACIPEYLKGPLEKLKHKQRVVYIGTVLTDPPVTRYRLALELGIRDVTQISRIKRQAERKMAGLLRPKVSS